MQPNQDQQEFWADTVGAIWVRRTGDIDAIFAPVLQAVLEAAQLGRDQAVLDVGCGAGTSSFEAAALVGPRGTVCGVDISEPFLNAARHDPRKGDGVSFILADAQTHAFAPAQFDRLISRFGVMFFEDSVAAFQNMARSLKSGGRMAFATWGTIEKNPFFTLPARLSATEIGPMPKSDPDAPGPFALRDTAKTLDILRDAGLAEATVDVCQIMLTPRGTAQDVAEMLCEIGPAKNALEDYQTGPAQRAAFVETLAAALRVYQTEKGLEIPAEINIFTASKPLSRNAKT